MDQTGGVDLIVGLDSDGNLRFKYLGQPPHFVTGLATFDSVNPGEVVKALQISPFFAGNQSNYPAAYINAMNPNDGAPRKANYILFRPHDGNVGVMQLLGTSENPRSVKIRYKLVQSSVTTTTRVSLPPAAPQPSFGPVIERVVANISDNPARACLDFSSGEFRVPPPAIGDRFTAHGVRFNLR